MGGNGSGLNRTNPNGALITALDEARWRLIAGRDHLRDSTSNLSRAYHAVKAAELEIEEATKDITALQRSLGDTELLDRESTRTEELTTSFLRPTRLDMIQAALAESAQVDGHLKAAVKRATA